MSRSAECIAAELDVVLQNEKIALLDGDIDALGETAELKKSLVQEFLEHSPDSDLGLSGLRDAAERNHFLLEGTLMGMRKVIERLNDLSDVAGKLNFYDVSGKPHVVELHERSIERSL